MTDIRTTCPAIRHSIARKMAVLFNRPGTPEYARELLRRYGKERVTTVAEKERGK